MCKLKRKKKKKAKFDTMRDSDKPELEPYLILKRRVFHSG